MTPLSDLTPQPSLSEKPKPTNRPTRRQRRPSEPIYDLSGKIYGKTVDEIHIKDFRVAEGDKVDLEKWPTKVDPVYESKEQYKKLLDEHVAKLSALQRLLTRRTVTRSC